MHLNLIFKTNSKHHGTKYRRKNIFDLETYKKEALSGNLTNIDKLTGLIFKLEYLLTEEEKNIIEHIKIEKIAVDKNCNEDKEEIHILGSCDWEIEHGLEISISESLGVSVFTSSNSCLP